MSNLVLTQSIEIRRVMFWLFGLIWILAVSTNNVSAKQLSSSIVSQARSLDITVDRYQYQLSLKGFTSDEVNIVSGIALSSIDKVNAVLIIEQTNLHFLNLALPTIEVTYEVSTPLSLSQFRYQMTQLFERMNVEAHFKYMTQENIFVISRAFSPYATELIILWSVLAICVYGLFLWAFWTWIEYRLNAFRTLDQASLWLKFLSRSRRLPLPLLIRRKWDRQIPYWENRVRQASTWFDNAKQLFQTHEFESASVFVKKSLEEDASNIAAKALNIAILEQLSMHKISEDGQEKWKTLLGNTLEFAKQGNTLSALEQAYTALALCEADIGGRRSAIELQINSIKSLIKRILLNKALSCSGLTLHSVNQEILINAGSVLNVGRADGSENENLHVLLPQDTVSRIGSSMAIVRHGNRFTVEDMGSTNGVWLEYARCEKGISYELSDMDQLHLSPPNETGTIGLKVRYVDASKSLALTLCQSAKLLSSNASAVTPVINPSHYAKHRWYLTQDDFYLVFSAGKFIWYCGSEWQTIDQHNKQDNEVLRIEFKHQAWLYVSNENYAITLDGYNIIGPIPLPQKSQLRVNETNIDIELIGSDMPVKNQSIVGLSKGQTSVEKSIDTAYKND